MGDLNSQADDVQAALTRRGDHVFLASDRARDSASGFGVYISRVVEGRELPPEKVDLYIEAGEATDPAVRMEGFDLLFSRAPTVVGDPRGGAPGGPHQYSCTPRAGVPGIGGAAPRTPRRTMDTTTNAGRRRFGRHSK